MRTYWLDECKLGLVGHFTELLCLRRLAGVQSVAGSSPRRHRGRNARAAFSARLVAGGRGRTWSSPCATCTSRICCSVVRMLGAECAYPVRLYNIIAVRGATASAGLAGWPLLPGVQRGSAVDTVTRESFGSLTVGWWRTVLGRGRSWACGSLCRWRRRAVSAVGWAWRQADEHDMARVCRLRHMAWKRRQALQ